jgi:hypothetical protein
MNKHTSLFNHIFGRFNAIYNGTQDKSQFTIAQTGISVKMYKMGDTMIRIDINLSKEKKDD